MRKYKHAKMTKEQRQEIEKVINNKDIPRRSHRRLEVVILSSQGYTLEEISEIYNVDRDTVSKWIDQWETNGIEGLLDKPKQNRKPKLNEEEREILKEILEKNPGSAREIAIEVKKQTGKEVSVWTIRRWAKRMKMKWKRLKRGLARKKDEVAYKQAKEEIEGFENQAKEGELDLYYFDATGFDLTPTVPYRWQAIGSTGIIPSSHSKRINVLGFLNPRTNDLQPFVVEGRVDTNVVIECFEVFSKTLTKPTIVILDNAPVHTSKLFLEKIDKWQERGLFIYQLPAYSPTLNTIEILWRNIKTRWLPIGAYESFDSLKKAIDDILINYGSKYQIHFA